MTLQPDSLSIKENAAELGAYHHLNLTGCHYRYLVDWFPRSDRLVRVNKQPLAKKNKSTWDLVTSEAERIE